MQSDATSSSGNRHSQKKLLLLDVPSNVCIHSFFTLHFYPSEVFSSNFQKDFGLKRLDFGSNLPLPHPQERTTNHEFWKLSQNGIHLA